MQLNNQLFSAYKIKFLINLYAFVFKIIIKSMVLVQNALLLAHLMGLLAFVNMDIMRKRLIAY
jgi:hypothetical protein